MPYSTGACSCKRWHLVPDKSEGSQEYVGHMCKIICQVANCSSGCWHAASWRRRCSCQCCNSATVSSQGMLHRCEPHVTHQGYRNKLPELSEQLVTSLTGSVCTVKHTPHVGVSTCCTRLTVLPKSASKQCNNRMSQMCCTDAKLDSSAVPASRAMQFYRHQRL